jgi:lipopolysaccharide exporter
MQLGEKIKKLRSMFDLRAETSSTVVTFILGSGFRLITSLVLTRILYPEAYGTIVILMSVLFVVEMLSDVGVVGLTVRHERGDDPLFLNTLWTVRLLRGCANALIVLLAAPWIAAGLGDPGLTNPLRVLSLYFIFNAAESMGFALAFRHQRSAIINYTSLVCMVISSGFCVIYSYYSRDYWGFVYSALLERVLQALASYFAYPAPRPQLAWDKPALKEVFAFARYVFPTSIITLVLSQLERLALLRLFDVFGVASSVGGPVESLGLRVSHTVLYPRFSSAHRATPGEMRKAFYSDSFKPMLLLFALPAVVGGSAQGIVDLLYDSRYAQAGFILQCFMVRALGLSFLRPREQLLTAVGHISVQLHTNVIRVVLLVPLLWLGYLAWGFQGFIAALALEPWAAVLYVLWRQHKIDLLNLAKDFQLLLFSVSIWLGAWFASFALAWAAAKVLGA